jgi:hypothetical protein
VVDEVSGAGEPSRRTRALVVTLVVLLVLGIGLDRWQVARERSALLEAVVGGEQVVQGSAASLRGLREYVGPLVSDVDARPEAREWAFDTLRADAARWRPRVREERTQVLDLAVAPWHGDVRAARDAYAGRLAAWDELLDGVGRRGRGSGASARVAAERASTALVVADLDERRVRDLLGLGEARSTTRR